MAKKRQSSTASNPIRILGFGSSRSGERFAKFQIHAGRKKLTCLLRIDDWGPSKFAELNRRGAHLIDDASRRAFSKQLQDSRPNRDDFKVATRLGWHRKYFVLPGRRLRSKAKLEVHLGVEDEALISKYRSGGSLDGWREINRLARGNSRFMLVLAQAFCGPLGDILDVEQPSIQLVGDPGSGKTTLAIAVGSVWGRHIDPERARALGFGESWNNTVNKTEPVALAHNHTLGIFDETRSGTGGNDLFTAIMRLAGGVEKGRLHASPSRGWWAPVLSTSNLSLDKLAQEAGIPIDDAYRGRLIDVPGPPGASSIFERLHEHSEPNALVQHVLRVAATNFGWAGRHYVRQLERDRHHNEKALRGALQSRRKVFLRYAKRLPASGREMGRIYEKFATIYAAGRLAADYKLLTWPRKELRKALLACLRDHIDLVSPQLGGGAGTTALTAVERLRAHIAAHRSNFVDLREGLVRKPKHDHGACLGYLSQYAGKEEFLVSDEQLIRIAGSEGAAQKLKKDLSRKDVIRSAGGGKGGKRFAVKAQIFDKRAGVPRRKYVVAVDVEALAAA